MNRLQPTRGRPIPSPLQKFNSARANLLLIVALTVANSLLYVAEAGIMFLFSASVPYYLVIFGHSSEIPSLFVCSIIVAAVILALYFICWLLSKKNRNWLKLSLALFVLDCIALLVVTFAYENTNSIMDIVIHALILYYLITGVSSIKKIDNMPPPEEGDFILDADPVLTGEGDYKNSKETEETIKAVEEE